MKRFTLFLVLCLVASAIMPYSTNAKTYTTTIGEGWLIRGADVQNLRSLGGLQGFGNTNPGKVWYVDGNRLNDGGDGTTWATAKKLLSSAMALSHADIATTALRQWASRNTIYVKGDDITEDFTTMAQKTDIIGVGSNDSYKKAGINGTWIIPDTVSYLGCRFFNIMFTDTGATAIIDMDTQGGIVFTDCLFDASPATTIGINAKDCSWLEVIGCEFSAVSATAQFDTACIQIDDGDNSIYGCRIVGNIMTGAAIGIDWDDTAAYNCFVTDNYIRAVGLTIDEEGDNIFVINNRLVTDVDTTTSTAGYDFNIQLSAGNIQMGATGLGDTIPFAKIAE